MVSVTGQCRCHTGAIGWSTQVPCHHTELYWCHRVTRVPNSHTGAIQSYKCHSTTQVPYSHTGATVLHRCHRAHQDVCSGWWNVISWKIGRFSKRHILYMCQFSAKSLRESCGQTDVRRDRRNWNYLFMWRIYELERRNFINPNTLTHHSMR